jgi:DNA-directed RNA polymerase subunit omega
MARITVDDCLKNVENRFTLVLRASQLARDIMSGAREPQEQWKNDKPTVHALREIADGTSFEEKTDNQS